MKALKLEKIHITEISISIHVIMKFLNHSNNNFSFQANVIVNFTVWQNFLTKLSENLPFLKIDISKTTARVEKR